MATSYLLVLSQFTILVLVVWQGDLVGWGSVLICLGAILGLWSVASMNYRVNVLPEIRDRQQLVMTGPYRFIRHPMYTSLLLVAGGLIENDISLAGSILWLALLVVLTFKVNREEKLLRKHFDRYEAYSRHSKKLIPFVY